MAIPCITVEDILSYPACCSAAADLCCPHEVIENNICLAIELIEGLTGLNICPYDDCKRFDGYGDCKLYFSPTTSDVLVNFSSIEKTGCNLEGCDPCPLKYDNITNCNTRLELCNNNFPCGSKNILVCGYWSSFKTIPESLRKAIMLLALEYSEPGITGINSSQGMVDSITWDDFSINYNTADISVTGGSTTGYQEIDRLLGAFIPTRSKIKFTTIGKSCKDCCKTHNKKDCKQC